MNFFCLETGPKSSLSKIFNLKPCKIILKRLDVQNFLNKNKKKQDQTTKKPASDVPKRKFELRKLAQRLVNKGKVEKILKKSNKKIKTQKVISIKMVEDAKTKSNLDLIKECHVSLEKLNLKSI